jgi:WD repeat-containing protein 6
LVIGYAHNFIEIISLEDFQIIKTFKGKNNCLLYSISFYGTNTENFYIASGTIFNQVIIWNIKDEKISTLKGHTGVIFNTYWSDDGKYISSASDGSIKIN